MSLDARMKQAESMVIGNLLNTVVQRAGLTNVGCPSRCEIKCNLCM